MSEEARISLGEFRRIFIRTGEKAGWLERIEGDEVVLTEAGWTDDESGGPPMTPKRSGAGGDVDLIEVLRELGQGLRATDDLGNTIPEDWSDRRYWFWETDDHGKKGIARSDKIRGPSGRAALSTDRTRWRFCEEHKDWEISRRRITSKQALRWALEARRHD